MACPWRNPFCPPNLGLSYVCQGDNHLKNWKKTQTRKVNVTNAMKVRRAEEIAKKLNDTRRWRSHGRGLSMAVLDKDLNLLIEDFGGEDDIRTEVRDYYRLLQDYMARRSQRLTLHTKKRYTAY